MMKTLTALMMGAALLVSAPAFAGNEADIIQQGGGFNSIQAKQKGHKNDFASSQDGFANSLKLKQCGPKNGAGAFQNGLFNNVKLKQKAWC